jgi:tetratricopeptide (TPR) repeat protein
MSTAFNAWYFRKMAVWSTLLKRDAMALEYWERVRALRPGDSDVVATIAHLKAAAGGRREAIALIHQALDIDPKRAAYWFNLGFLQQEEGDHQQALDSFERALKLDEKLDRAWYGKALSLIKLGRIEEAIEPLQRNTELQPMSPYGWYQLAHVYHRLGDSAKVARVIRKLSGFEPKVAKQLERETGVNVGVEVPF